MSALAVIGLAGMAATAQLEGVNAVVAVDSFVVINNTNAPLTCAKNGGSGWGDWFTIASGAEWNDIDFDIGASAKFQCRPPVRGLSYTIVAGKRYSLLRAADGGVDLVEVTAGEH